MIAELLIWISRVTTGMLVASALIPLVPVGGWMIRLFDFPRVQFTVLLVIPLIAIVAHGMLLGAKLEHAALLAGIVAAAGWQLAHILPYSPIWTKELADAKGGDHGLRVLIANLEVTNRGHAEARRVLENQDADILLLIEIDSEWDDALDSLRDTFPYRTGVVRGEGLGLQLWSRLPLRDAEVRHLVSRRRPSIFATIELPNGRLARFVGVHPTPPGLDDATEGGRRDSRVRDAELVLVAREIARDTESPWIVTGDFNDVAWSHTGRIFKRLSGLRDPRVGRKLLNSYHAELVFLRFPIDQIFFSEGFAVHGLDRVTIPGSDHFAIFADVSLEKQRGTKPEISAEDSREAEAIVAEGKAHARDREVSAGASP